MGSLLRAGPSSGGGSLSNSVLSGYFGTGTDGDVTISSGTTTLSRDMYYNNLTINGTGKLVHAQFKIFVRETLDLSAAGASAIASTIVSGTAGQANGTAGSATASPAAGTLGTGPTGNGGGAGSTTNGVAAGTATAGQNGGASGPGGQGGSGSGGVGGNARVAASTTNVLPIYGFNKHFLRAITLIVGGAGSPGGSGGGGDTSVSGGGGGGGAGGGVVMAIFANKISRGASTATGAIACKGNNGGAGGSPASGDTGGGGGGAGSGGGWIYIAYASLVGPIKTGMIDVTGGQGAAAGNGSGTGTGGQGGGGGAGGRVTLLNVSTNTISETFGTVATNGGNASGTTGGIAGVPNTAQVDL